MLLLVFSAFNHDRNLGVAPFIAPYEGILDTKGYVGAPFEAPFARS